MRSSIKQIQEVQMQFLAGPTTGSAAAPTFRALVAADIPTLTAAKVSDFDTQVRTNRVDQLASATNPVTGVTAYK